MKTRDESDSVKSLINKEICFNIILCIFNKNGRCYEKCGRGKISHAQSWNDSQYLLPDFIILLFSDWAFFDIVGQSMAAVVQYFTLQAAYQRRLIFMQ